MKAARHISYLLLIGMGVMLTSCRKSFVCECKVDGKYSHSYLVREYTKRKAKKQCDKYDVLDFSKVIPTKSTDCSVK